MMRFLDVLFALPGFLDIPTSTISSQVGETNLPSGWGIPFRSVPGDRSDLSMHIPYFIFTSGEEGVSRLDWGVKFASPELSPFNSNHTDHLSEVDKAYRKLCKEYSCPLVPPIPGNPKKPGLLLLPWKGSSFLVGYIFPYKDSTGRPNVSLVAAVVSSLHCSLFPDLHVFSQELSRQNPLEEIAKRGWGESAKGERPRTLLLEKEQKGSTVFVDGFIFPQNLPWPEKGKGFLLVDGEKKFFHSCFESNNEDRSGNRKKIKETNKSKKKLVLAFFLSILVLLLGGTFFFFSLRDGDHGKRAGDKLETPLLCTPSPSPVLPLSTMTPTLAPTPISTPIPTPSEEEKLEKELRNNANTLADMIISERESRDLQGLLWMGFSSGFPEKYEIRNEEIKSFEVMVSPLEQELFEKFHEKLQEGSVPLDSLEDLHSLSMEKMLYLDRLILEKHVFDSMAPMYHGCNFEKRPRNDGFDLYEISQEAFENFQSQMRNFSSMSERREYAPDRFSFSRDDFAAKIMGLLGELRKDSSDGDFQYIVGTMFFVFHRKHGLYDVLVVKIRQNGELYSEAEKPKPKEYRDPQIILKISEEKLRESMGDFLKYPQLQTCVTYNSAKSILIFFIENALENNVQGLPFKLFAEQFAREVTEKVFSDYLK